MKRTVIRMLNLAVKRYGNAPYVLEKDNKGYVPKSYIQIAEESDLFAKALIANGCEKGDKIAVLAEGRNAWVMTEFGILKAGAISVPLSIKLQPKEILFRINHSDSKYIIVSRNTIKKVIEIWDEIKIPDFSIIYLEKSLTDIQKDLKNINLNKHFFLLAELIEEGKSKSDIFDKDLKERTEAVEEDDVVTISYTSGTTGNPKGIMLTHLNYYANSRDAMEFFDVREYSRLMIILPLDHSFAHTVGIYASLVRGLAIYFVDSRGGALSTLKNIPINLKEANPHFMLTVPALTGNFMNKMINGIKAKGGIIEKIFNAGLKAGFEIHGNGFEKIPSSIKLRYMAAYKLADKLIFRNLRKVFGSNMKYCVGGGALLDVRQQRFFYSIGIPIYQGYGQTEATPIISTNTPNDHKLGSSGKVLPQINAKIINGKGELAKTGEKGELLIQGENVMKGYYKNKKATAEALKDGWLHTEDLGYFDKDGFLIITGREKALLISQDGEKYSPEEIEEAMVNCSDLVFQAMIHNDHNKYTVGLITLNKTAIETLIRKKGIKKVQDLLEEIKESVYNFKKQDDYIGKFPNKYIPSMFIIIEEPFSEKNLMINSTMKMVWHIIRKTYNDAIMKMYFNDAANQTNKINTDTLRRMFFDA